MIDCAIPTRCLKPLESFDIKSMGFGSAEYIHHFVEAKKIAFADRAKYYADMDFNKVPVKYLISKEGEVLSFDKNVETDSKELTSQIIKLL